MQQVPFGNVTVSLVPWGSAGDDGVVVVGAVRQSTIGRETMDE